MVIQKKQIALITKHPVDYLFNGTKCHLHRTFEFIGDNYTKEVSWYRVRTDYVTYKETQLIIQGDEIPQELDEFNPNEVLEPIYEEIIKNVNILTYLETKQDWFKLSIPFNEVNHYWNVIPLPEAGKKEQEAYLMKQLLLGQTLRDLPFNIEPGEWKIRDDETDLIINLEQ